jgi:DUF4097 and DUF4098 domain-containing protein YvlB
MTVMSPARSFALASVVCAVTIALPQAQQAGDAITVPFSDPARIGSVRVSIHTGGIVVKGGNRRDVLVTSRGEDGRRQSAPPAGLKRLTQAVGLSIAEENNQISIGTSGRTREIDVELQVPNRVNLNLQTHNDGDVIVENAEGDIEVQNHNGGIRLTNIAGSAVANTHNGDVHVTLTRITVDKAMSFISYNGDVDVTLPATAKANLKLRSDNGEILTGFDVQTKPAPQAPTTRDSRGRTRIEVNQSIFGTINGGGPEFELRTFNGNIYVRRGAQ